MKIANIFLNNEQLASINSNVDKCSQYTKQELIREVELGTANSFAENAEVFEIFFQFFPIVTSQNLSTVSADLMINWNIAIDQIIKIFDEIKNYSPNTIHSKEDRKRMLSSSKKMISVFYQRSTQIIIFLTALNGLSQESTDIPDRNVTELNSFTKDIKEQMLAVKDEAVKTLENIKAFATSSGVSKHSEIFEKEAMLHRRAARKWLISSFIILGLIIAIAIIGAILSINYNDHDHTIQIAISKVVMLTALFYGLSITNKTYKAHKHNELMNKHRHNALTTFETFANAASADDHTKNAVLLETTRTIFSNQSTGYLKPDNEAEGTQKIIEIIKAPGRGEA